jgi:hypothetical protein
VHLQPPSQGVFPELKVLISMFTIFLSIRVCVCFPVNWTNCWPKVAQTLHFRKMLMIRQGIVRSLPLVMPHVLNKRSKCLWVPPPRLIFSHLPLSLIFYRLPPPNSPSSCMHDSPRGPPPSVKSPCNSATGDTRRRRLAAYNPSACSTPSPTYAPSWYVSNVSIIFDAPCLFLHHLPNVSLHFLAFLCDFRN